MEEESIYRKSIYTVNQDLNQIIIKFLEDSMAPLLEAIDLLKSKEKLDFKEINKIVSVLGKFPANEVWPILDRFSSSLKVEEVE
jgi:hypothetical protein